MAKTDKDLQELKKKVEEVGRELKELSEEELEEVAGGLMILTSVATPLPSSTQN